MKVRAIIQARMGSSRLKGKSLLPVAGVPLLERVVKTVKRLRFVDEVMVATTELKEDEVIAKFAEDEGVKAFRGSVSDVLERFTTACRDLHADDCIVRVTADNLFNDYQITEKLFALHRSNRNDYTYVDGLSHVVNEFVRVGALRSASASPTLDSFDREHVTPLFRKRTEFFKVQRLPSDFQGLRPDLGKLLTIDTIDDLVRIENIAKVMNIEGAVNFKEVYKWLESNK